MLSNDNGIGKYYGVINFINANGIRVKSLNTWHFLGVYIKR